MLNPLAWVIDRLTAPLFDYPRVPATRDCDDCGARQGGRHRLTTCDGNGRDVRRQILADYPGEEMTDEEVDRRQAAALEQHRRNQAEEER